MSEEQLERIEQKLDLLTNSVDGRFNRVDERLDRVDERLDRVDERFNRVDERFDGVDERLGQLDAGILSLVQKTDRIEGKLDSLEETQMHINNELSEHLKRHEHRIGALEARKP